MMSQVKMVTLRKLGHKLLALGFISFLYNSILLADKFEKIMRTDEFISASRSVKNFSPELPDWVHPESPYGLLFNEEDEARETILSWMPSEDDGLNVRGNRFREKNDYIYASRDYKLPDLTVITLTFIIPHPGSFELAEQGLIPEYKKIRPDSSQILAKENFFQKDLNFDLYQLIDKSVVVVSELPQKVLVSYSVQSYAKVPQLRRFMESVSYVRMIEVLKNTHGE